MGSTKLAIAAICIFLATATTSANAAVTTAANTSAGTNLASTANSRSVDAVLTIDGNFDGLTLDESQSVAHISAADDDAAWQLDLAAGYSVVDVSPATSTVRITGDGNTVSLVLPIALDSAGQPVPIETSIDGTTLHATVANTDTALAYPVQVFLGADVSATLQVDVLSKNARTAAAQSRLAKVQVPAEYIYDPSLGTLHDYCSYSADTFFKADFRGPCARHDLCYEAYPHSDDKMANCQQPFRTNLRTNCHHAYYRTWDALAKGQCYAVAGAYHWAVMKWLEAQS